MDDDRIQRLEQARKDAARRLRNLESQEATVVSVAFAVHDLLPREFREPWGSPYAQRAAQVVLTFDDGNTYTLSLADARDLADRVHALTARPGDK